MDYPLSPDNDYIWGSIGGQQPSAGSSQMCVYESVQDSGLWYMGACTQAKPFLCKKSGEHRSLHPHGLGLMSHGTGYRSQ